MVLTPSLSLSPAQLDDQARTDADTVVETDDLDAGLGLTVADQRAKICAAKRAQGADQVESLEDGRFAGAVVSVEHSEARAKADFARAQVAKLAEVEVLELQVRCASA